MVEETTSLNHESGKNGGLMVTFNGGHETCDTLNMVLTPSLPGDKPSSPGTSESSHQVTGKSRSFTRARSNTNGSDKSSTSTSSSSPSCCSSSGSTLTNNDYSCGLCSFKPNYLQDCANKKMFLAIFCLTSVLQGMFYTYFVSVLTTIEKLYQIQSKTTGLIMSATEMGQIGGVLFLTYYGGQGNRPKWIACGMIVFAFASLLSASPHYLFGGQSSYHHAGLTGDTSRTAAAANSLLNHHHNQSDPWNSKESPAINNNIGLLMMQAKLCHPSNLSSNLFNGTSKATKNQQAIGLIASSLSDGGDDSSVVQLTSSRCSSLEQTENHNRITKSVLGIFFASLLLIGLGSTATNTLGIPYIDDNVAPRESPLYFGITIGVKIFGPVIGFLLGSLCTNIHVDFPFGESAISNPSDPQWIGAWWLGMVIVGISLVIVSFFMMSFPRRLPKPDPSSFCHIQQQNSRRKKDKNAGQVEPMLGPNQSPEHDGDKSICIANGSTPIKSGQEKSQPMLASKPNLKDFPGTLKRLLRNDILLFRTASSVLHILPIAGIYTFLPKYLESQFQLTASIANMIAGIAGILVMGFGVFSSSIFMRKFKPTPRFVASWIAFAALVYSLGMVVLMWLGCPLNNFVGFNVKRDVVENSSTCWNECSCAGQFSPICTSDKMTYLSPCIAGCTKVAANESSYLYSDCHCLGSSVTATSGYCPLNCTNLTWYIAVFSTIVLVHSTSEVGSMLLTLRCVEPRDKAMALGLISFAIGLFGNVPCPILYGAVVDSACLFWEENCGKLGACRVYDSIKFRTVFHGVTAVIMFAAFLVDVIVWYKASSIKFDDDDQGENEPDKRNLPTNEMEEEDYDEVKVNGNRSSELKPLNKPKSPNDNGNRLTV